MDKYTEEVQVIGRGQGRQSRGNESFAYRLCVEVSPITFNCQRSASCTCSRSFSTGEVTFHVPIDSICRPGLVHLNAPVVTAAHAAAHRTPSVYPTGGEPMGGTVGGCRVTPSGYADAPPPSNPSGHSTRWRLQASSGPGISFSVLFFQLFLNHS